MAIVRNAFGHFTTSGSFNCAGTSSTYLIAFVSGSSGTLTASYNGVAMTSLAGISTTSTQSNMFGLANPATGSNTLSISSSGGSLQCEVVSYDNVAAVSTPDGTGTNAGSSGYSVSVTTTINNDWVVYGARVDTGLNPTASTNAFFIVNSTGGSDGSAPSALYDSNGAISPAQTYTMLLSGSSSKSGNVAVALALQGSNVSFTAPLMNMSISAFAAFVTFAAPLMNMSIAMFNQKQSKFMNKGKSAISTFINKNKTL